MKITNLVKKIAEATDINDHNQAVMYLAQALEDTDSIAELKAIIATHNSLGHMPFELIQYRSDIKEGLFFKLSSVVNHVEFDQILNAF